MKLKDYWMELQRRHVVKAGIAYLVVAWLVLQVLDLLLDAFQLGAGWMQTAIIILSVGFPIWLILAWVYDFSWGSIQKTEDVPFDAEVSRKKNIGLNRVIIGGLSIAVILLVVNSLRLSGKVNAFEDQLLPVNFVNSLAILPFQNLSAHEDQRYFSDGLARSIYDRLARSRDLKLISPTSSFQYRDKDVSIEVIAEELDVRFVLEGSVQLFDNRYRASINLVDTQDATTIWSKTFDDSLENVLNTYDEVAESVGSFLDITLTSRDVRQKKVDPEAYLLFLEADALLRNETYSKNSVIVGDSLIKRSLAIDPDYSPSQSKLAQTTFHKTIYWGLLKRPLGLAIAKEAALKAIDLDPEDPWGYLWVSNVSWHDRDIKSFEEFYLKMVEKGPNHPDVAMYQGFCKNRTNQVEEAYFFDRKAAMLSPKDNEYNYTMGHHEMFRSEYDKAAKWFNNINSEWLEWRTLGLAEVKIYSGYFQQAEELILSLPTYLQSYSRVKMLTFEGKRLEAEIELKRLIEFDQNTDGFGMYGTENEHFWTIAGLYAIMRDFDKAFEYLDKAYPAIVVATEYFFSDYDFKSLYDDPRWDAYLERLGKEFNYDFTHGS